MATQLMELKVMRAHPLEWDRLDGVPIDSASTREQARRGCPRCGGFLVGERCLDLYEGLMVAKLDRCVQCGNLDDARLRQNRMWSRR